MLHPPGNDYINSYVETESLEKCSKIYDYNKYQLPYLKTEWLSLCAIYKYKNSGYYQPLTLSIGIAVFLMTSIAWMYEDVDIAEV